MGRAPGVKAARLEARRVRAVDHAEIKVTLQYEAIGDFVIFKIEVLAVREGTCDHEKVFLFFRVTRASRELPSIGDVPVDLTIDRSGFQVLQRLDDLHRARFEGRFTFHRVDARDVVERSVEIRGDLDLVGRLLEFLLAQHREQTERVGGVVRRARAKREDDAGNG